MNSQEEQTIKQALVALTLMPIILTFLSILVISCAKIVVGFYNLVF